MANKDVVRGIIVNLIGLALLCGIGFPMDLVTSAGISLGINWLVFLFQAMPQQSEKFFDATGSVTYLALIATANLLLTATHDIRGVVSSVMVAIWCIRLGSYLLQRILRDGKDSRFDEFKHVTVRFLGVWTLQATWCFLVSSPALVMITSDTCVTSIGISDYVGWAVWLFAFTFEVVADRQKDAFRLDPANKGKFITTGLWAYSRHPNYFGEILMWIGICTSGSTCFAGWQWLAWFSPLITFLLLTKVSGVPMLEKTGDKRWGHLPEYQHYMKHTPCIFPAIRKPPAYAVNGYAPLLA